MLQQVEYCRRHGRPQRDLAVARARRNGLFSHGRLPPDCDETFSGCEDTGSGRRPSPWSTHTRPARRRLGPQERWASDALGVRCGRLPERREIKKIALARPQDHDLPFSTWSLSKLADFLVAEGVVGVLGDAIDVCTGVYVSLTEQKSGC